jgi:hypothetical protein
METRIVNGITWTIGRSFAEYAGQKIPFWYADSDQYAVTADSKIALRRKMAAHS